MDFVDLNSKDRSPVKNISQVSSVGVTTIGICFALLAGSALTFFSVAQAAVPKFKDAKHVTTFMLEQIRTREDLIKALEASQVSIEGMKIIAPDLKRRLPDRVKYPKFKLVKNQLFVNGKPSGLKFLSHQPVTISYKKQTWKYNPEKPFEESYFQILELLEGKKSSSISRNDWTNWILPTAHARVDGGQGFFQGTSARFLFTGGIAGAFAGAIFARATDQDKVTGGLVGGLLGAFLGGLTNTIVNPTSSPTQDETLDAPVYESDSGAT